MKISVLMFLMYLSTVIGPGDIIANTLHVANDGNDTTGCGASATPCRSISRAIANANSGDEIIVGPGIYGDVNADGAFTPGSGDEAPSGGGMIAVKKPLSIVSSAGAASTVIRFTSGGGAASFVVAISAAGVRFGGVDRGFSVVGDGSTCSAGIRGLGPDSIIEGNILTRCFRGADLTGAGVRLARNRALVNSEVGFVTRAEGAVVTENSATSNGFTGFVTESLDWQMSKNASIGNEGDGATVDGNGSFTGNAMIGNARTGLGVNGFLVAGIVHLTISGNSFYANRSLGGNCGIFNNTYTVLDAPRNFWGLPTGPGADPADLACGNPIGVTPWLTSPAAEADVFGPLVQGVSQIGGVGFPSGITGWSEDWQIIATGDEDNGPPPTHYVMARPYGQGRVLALGHESMLTPGGLAALDNGQFITNVIEWLDKANTRKVLFTTGHDEGIVGTVVDGLRALLPNHSFDSVSAPLTPSLLPSDAVVIIGHAKADFTANEIEAIRQFVGSGGGLLLAAQGWAWMPYWQRPLDEFPMNRVGEPFKIRWVGANLRDPTDETAGEEAIYHNFYPDPRTLRQMGVINNLMNFTPYNYRTTSDTAGCPSGFVGKFLFDALLVLKNRMQPVSSLDVRAMELTNGNLVQNAFGDPGGTGATVAVPFHTDYADGIFRNGGEYVTVPFVICLKTMQRFRFFVDVLGRFEDAP